MEGTLDFANANWGRILNSNNATKTHSIFARKYLFRHAKGKSMVNFYTVNALCQNLHKLGILLYSEIVVRGQTL